jgi:hypothetical protein
VSGLVVKIIAIIMVFKKHFEKFLKIKAKKMIIRDVAAAKWGRRGFLYSDLSTEKPS